MSEDSFCIGSRQFTPKVDISRIGIGIPTESRGHESPNLVDRDRQRQKESNRDRDLQTERKAAIDGIDVQRRRMAVVSPGICLPERCIDPDQMFPELEARGCEFSVAAVD